MDREDRIKIDQSKDKLQKIISVLREVEAGYGLESRSSTDPEAKRRSQVDSGIIKRIIDLYQIEDLQNDQINKHAEIIVKLRMEIDQLKSELKSMKK